MSEDNLLDTDVSIENIKESGEDKILIYHTHGSESFADSREGVKEDTIIGVGIWKKFWRKSMELLHIMMKRFMM